jgi:hypothetical protein
MEMCNGHYLHVSSVSGFVYELKATIDFLGSMDFLIEKSQDPGWIGNMWNYLLTPTPKSNFVLILLGIGIAIWSKFPTIRNHFSKKSQNSISLFYDEHNPNCRQIDGRVFVPIVGAGDVEHYETIYRLGVRAQQQLRGCRLILERSEPEPHNPGQQRLGLAMRPRIPMSTGSEELIVNPDAPAYIDVLQEIVRRDNPMHEQSRIRLIYVNEDRGRASWIFNNCVLTFRLEGPITPVRLRLALEFDGRLRIHTH